MKDEAMFILDEMELDAFSDTNTDLPVGLCLFEPHWHQGVIGILASRIKDRLHRPVIIFAQADDGTVYTFGYRSEGEIKERATKELDRVIAYLRKHVFPIHGL